MREGTLRELNVKVGDEVRPIFSGYRKTPIEGKLLVLTYVDHVYCYYKGHRADREEDSWQLAGVETIFQLGEEAVSDDIKVGDGVEINRGGYGWREGYTVLAIQDKDPNGYKERKWCVVAFKSDIPQVFYFHEVRKPKPKPVVEEVVMFGGQDHRDSWGFDVNQLNPCTHRITFNTVNGEPDCNSIKMEKL